MCVVLFKISKEAETVLNLLEENDFEAYLVGGCVRDFILDRPCNDYDITTSAFPEEIKEVFKEYKTVDTGISHGTVTVIVKSQPFEITTYRIDGEYIDNRHPEKVLFSRNLEDDLKRRDFTVNAMAYNKQLVDLYGGINDLKNKVIRCVGDADTRFKEDGLRIIRALRFSSVLGFEIEESTSDAIIRNRDLLNNISPERIFDELKKLLCGKNVKNVIQKYSTVFETIFTGKEFNKRAEYIEKCTSDHDIRFASLFLYNPNYKTDYKFLRPDNQSYKRVISLIENFDIDIYPDKVDLKKKISKYGVDFISDIIELKGAEGHSVADIKETFHSIINGNECYTLKSLNVNGDDIKSLGLSGNEIGLYLNDCLEKVIEEKIKNNKENLLDYVKEKIK